MNEQQKDSLLTLTLAALFSLASVVTIIAVIPRFKYQVKNWYLGSDRKVLSRLEEDITHKGQSYTFVKLRFQNDIILEIYDEKISPRQLLNSFTFENAKDGYFQLKGDSTNMGLVDIDNDQILELIVPVFDQNLVARLNVFKFNLDSQKFEKIVNTQTTF
jgi:hypothetical protein